MKDLFGNEVPEPTLYDFSVMNVELTKQFLSDTYDKHNSKGHDMLMRTRITRRVLSILALHPDWDEDEVFQKVQNSFRKGGGTVIARKIDRELYNYFLQNWRDIIKLEDIKPGHEYYHYAHHSNDKLTKEQWVAKARAKWGDAYDYTDSVYIAGLKPITIRCIKHDYPFTVQAGNHICTSNKRNPYMGGCPICSQERLAEYRKQKHEEALQRQAERERNNPPKPKKQRETPAERFLRRAKAMYPDYDFSQVEYKGREENVTIICPVHGPFEITPRVLLNGDHNRKAHGCWKCNGILPPEERKFTLEKFRAKMQELYGDKYTFVWSDFKYKSTQIRFHCPEHGEQKRSARVLLEGKGCEYCNGKFYPPDWIKNARKVHGDKYEYDENQPPKVIADYIRYKCPVHGWQRARYDSHVTQGHGCKWCAGIYTSVPVEERKQRWLDQCHERFGDRFDYSQVEYVNNDSIVKIYCKEHEYLFETTPDTHVRGYGGCPYCSASVGEVHIRKWLDDNNVKYDTQIKVPNENPDLDLYYLVPDFFLPDYNLYIEMNGRQHYEEVGLFKKHRNRDGSLRERERTLELQMLRDETFRKYCQDHNHNLLEIKYDQIERIPQILKRTLKKYAHSM